MQISVLTEGSEKIGFGHITRCLALCQAANEVIGPARVNFVINGDRCAEEFLKAEGADSCNFDWQKEKGRTFELLGQSDLVIIDSYLAAKALYDEISVFLYSKLGPAPLFSNPLLMLDDYSRIEYPAGVVVNPSMGANRLTYKQKDKTLYLLGRDYIILRKEFWPVSEKVINRNIGKVLISFGGISFCGPCYEKIRSQLRSEFSSNLDVIDTQHVKVSAGKMFKFMLDADICISGGGQTTYELSRVGVPTAVINFADNQRFNIEGLEAEGVIRYMGRHTDRDLAAKLSETIKALSPYEARLKLSRKAKRLIDGKGVRRIINRLTANQ